MASDFISDYVEYHNHYEIPRRYVFWCALGLLGATINRKVIFWHGDIPIMGQLYIMLVGPQGNGKTTPNDFARGFFEEACPEFAVGASTQSAEDIVKTMSDTNFPTVPWNYNGETLAIRPYAFFVNEFKNFVAYNPARMLTFLGDIYDRFERFKSSTLKRGVEDVVYPSVNVLACENPDWLIRNLKGDVVSGGFSRRIIYVYETARPDPIAFIDRNNPVMRAAKDRIITRLKQIKTVSGIYQWAPSGKKFYEPWYEEKQRNLINVPNALMQGYLGTKHIQLFKVAMLLDAASDKPMFVFTDELLQHALTFLDAIEDNMPKLSLAAGRNELAISQQRILEELRLKGGCVNEKEIKRFVESDLNWRETMEVLRHLEDTSQIIRKTFEGKPGTYLILPETYEAMIQKGIIKVIKPS